MAFETSSFRNSRHIVELEDTGGGVCDHRGQIHDIRALVVHGELTEMSEFDDRGPVALRNTILLEYEGEEELLQPWHVCENEQDGVERVLSEPRNSEVGKAWKLVRRKTNNSMEG